MRPHALVFGFLFTACLLAAHAADPVQLETLSASISAAILEEEKAIGELSAENLQEKQMETATQSELRAYRILIASHRNLLLSPHTSLADLEKGLADQQAGLDLFDSLLQRMEKQREKLQTLRMQTENRTHITTEQKAALASDEEKSPETLATLKVTEKLLALLTKKGRLLETMASTLEKRSLEIREIRQDMQALLETFQQAVKERKTLNLFQKNEGFRAFLDPDTPIAIFLHARNAVFRLLTPSFWVEEIRPVSRISPVALMRMLVLSLFLIPVTFRIRSFLKNLEAAHPSGWRAVLLETSRRSLSLLVLAAFMQSLVRSQPGLAATGLFKVLPALIWFLALLRLLTAFPRACRGEARPAIPPTHHSLLRSLTRIFALFAPVFILSAWIFPQDSPLLLIERLTMEILIVIKVFRFWSSETPATNPSPSHRTAFEITSKAIALGAPVLELLGYGSLALFWYWGWGVTLIALGGYLLFFIAVREWVNAEKASSSDIQKGSGEARPLLRLGVRLLPFVLLPLPLLLISRAWGLHESLLPLLLDAFRYPVTFGGMAFSLLSLFQTICVLLLTLGVTRTFRGFMEKRILLESGVEQGLRASILTLMGYLIWGIGILAALHVFGLNTTSLTVAFGALGVGLGFGLQAIFNNFVSGIILLFERPIQVGDVIEIDGIWGTVTRINVRSTVVQTYDNASLIIPNADFISSRLTNWSFKDQRIRKHIDVGVSYDADIRKVEKLLMEIATNTKGVLVYPQPDVHFMDFADSALLFRLRFWSTLDDFRVVETAIRFSITLEFRKAGIEIPYPQQDLHLRSDFRVAMDQGAPASPPRSGEPENPHSPDPRTPSSSTP